MEKEFATYEQALVPIGNSALVSSYDGNLPSTSS